MPQRFDFYTHGLWLLGSVFFFVGAIIAGNLRWVEGTTEASFLLAILLSFSLFAIAGLMWISAGTNAALERQEELPRDRREELKELEEELKEMKEAMKEEEPYKDGEYAEKLKKVEKKHEREIRDVEKYIEEIKRAMKEEEPTGL